MKTFAALPLTDLGQMELPLTSSAAGFPVRISVTPADGLASMENEAGSGTNTRGSLKKSARAGSLSKTCPPFAVADWELSSGKSLRSAMMRNGTVYPLPPLALLTGVIASGLLPTPQARDFMPAHNPEYIKAKRAQGHGMSNLNDFVAHQHLGLWPTPRASANENRQKKLTPSQQAGKHGLSLAEMANLWPTPTANRRSGLQSHGRNAILGVLNPRWVEWLMGYPIRWLSPNFAPSEIL